MPRERKATAAESAKRQMVVRVPGALPHQRTILESPARFLLVCAGRRYGKTLGGLIACIQGRGPGRCFRGAVDGGTIWWVAPTYGIASLIWDELKYALRDAWTDKSEMERKITLPGGGSVTVKSSDNPDLLRGAGLDGVVLDEAAMCVPQTWYEALRPALADRKGWALLITTPRGQNWFQELWEQAAQDPEWARFQAPTTANPLIDPSEIEAARRNLPDQTFLQEFLAEFVREGGAVFRRDHFRYWRDDPSGERVLLKPDGAEERRVGAQDGVMFVTVDLAVSQKTTADYTVFAVWHQTTGTDLLLVDLVRDRIQGPDQVPALRELCGRYPVSGVVIETVQYQLAVLQEAVRTGLPARGVTPDRDKTARAVLAATRYASGKVFHRKGAPWIGTLEEELLAFPYGRHDDQVDAVSMASMEVANSWSGLSEYYASKRATGKPASALLPRQKTPMEVQHV